MTIEIMQAVVITFLVFVAMVWMLSTRGRIADLQAEIDRQRKLRHAAESQLSEVLDLLHWGAPRQRNAKEQGDGFN